MSIYMVLNVGIIITVAYVLSYLLVHYIQKRLPLEAEVPIAITGFFLRMILIGASAKLITAFVSIDITYVFAGFLFFHSLWLMFITIRQLSSIRNNQLIKS